MSQLCGRSAYLKGFTRFACCLLASTFLASCGQSAPGGAGNVSESSVSYGDTLQPLTVPPVAGQGPAAPGTTGAPKTADGLPMLDAKGVKTNLFSEKLSSEDARLNRLENAVQEIRNDFDSMAPAIVRLVAIEKDIQNLIGQLEVLTGNAPPPVVAEQVPPMEPVDFEGEFPPVEGGEPLEPVLPAVAAQAPMETVPSTTAAPLPVPAEPAPVVPAPSAPASTPAPQKAAAATPAGPAVTDVRVGEHPGKTRIVLDVKGKTTFKTNLDNGEKILLIELSDVAWNAAIEKNFGNAPLLASYRANAEGAGMVLVLQLKSQARIVSSSSLNEAGTQRIVIDIAPL